MQFYSRSLLFHLPELIEIQRIAYNAPKGLIKTEVLSTLRHRNIELPLLSLSIGSEDPQAPTFLLTAGVHGLERIGTRVVNSYVRTLINYAKWDESTKLLLRNCCLIVIPIVNPIGMYFGTRANGSGVDLMRNAPVEGDKSTTTFLAGGHRFTPKLPWYRGKEGAKMEAENLAVIQLIEQRLKFSRNILSLDVHSGFGKVDRLWFPYAKTESPFPHLAEVYNLKRALDSVYPNHIYRFEPQSKNYTTHGDLWDYIYDQNSANRGLNLILPLTLELGSWLWIKKNPIQMFSTMGIFNPLLPHRTQRILRRHISLLEFLHRASAFPKMWVAQDLAQGHETNKLAMAHWYGSKGNNKK